MQKYLETLTEKQRKESVIIAPSSERFRFGGGEVLRSKGLYKIPAVMAGKHVEIKTDVVLSDIPLLLSLGSMKKAGILLDTATDTAEVLGKRVNLNFTTSGHYCLSLRSDDVFPVKKVQKVLAVDRE